MNLVINLLVRVFIIFCVMPIHEFAHALVSHLLGDDTARLKGRMTLNPVAHIDPIGALMIVVAGFGWAKPVPTNIRNFKKRKPYMALTALAGPVSNIIMAFLFMVANYTVLAFAVRGNVSVDSISGEPSSLVGAIALFLSYAASINISLAVFNLIPIPPLDGSRILTMIIPDKYYYKIMSYERYISLGVMALVILGVLDTPMGILNGVISAGLSSIASFPLKLFV